MASILQMRALQETIANARTRLQTIAGATFGGLRNIAQALGYKAELTVDDYRLRYSRNPIARRVVDSLPKATWKGVGELIENDDPTTITEFEDAWFDLSYKHRVWAMFNRADRAAGIGSFAVLLIGAPGKLETPLPKKSGDAGILYLAVHGEGAVVVKEWETGFENPRFGLPNVYTLKIKNPNQSGATIEKQVHWTRCIHVADGLLDNDVYAEPRLKCVWNNLDDLDKVVGGGSEAFWLRAHQGYQFDLDPEVILDEKGEQDLKEEVDEFMNGMRRAIRTRGMKVTTLGSDTADFGPSVDAIMKLISAGSTIPMRIIMGSERGQLASTQDADNWDERINDRRSEFAEPFVVRPFIDRLIEYGYLPKPEWYDVRWPVTEMSDTEKAAFAERLASVNQKAGETVVLANEIRDHAFGWEPLDEEEINPETDEEDVEVTDIADDELRAAVKSLRAAVRSHRRYGTALDKRRRWWRRKNGRKRSPAQV